MCSTATADVAIATRLVGARARPKRRSGGKWSVGQLAACTWSRYMILTRSAALLVNGDRSDVLDPALYVRLPQICVVALSPLNPGPREQMRLH